MVSSMKSKLLIVALASISVVVTSTARAEEITITVKGMVCAFCAQGIKKAFGKLPDVERVEADLDNKVVVIGTKSGTTIDDVRVTSIVNDAGYEVVNIERKP